MCSRPLDAVGLARDKDELLKRESPVPHFKQGSLQSAHCRASEEIMRKERCLSPLQA